MLSQELSLDEKIIDLLLEPKFRHKGISISAVGIPIFFRYKRQSIINSLARLRKKEFIERIGSDKIMILPKGRAHVESRKVRLKLFSCNMKSKTSRDFLVLFDIPEDRKGEREWFRSQLREFGYELVQKSVWLGNIPLSKELTEYIKEIGLRDHIKIFILKSLYSI